jgi:hypothetical protein
MTRLTGKVLTENNGCSGEYVPASSSVLVKINNGTSLFDIE